MKEVKSRLWKEELNHHKFLIFISLAFIILAIIATSMASRYVDKIPAKSVSDMILDNIPAIDLSFLFAYGFILASAVFFLYPLFYNPKMFHVALSQYSLLVIIRSFFIILTHLKIPTDAIITNLPAWYRTLTFNNDLFFSGHAAVPFLGYLIFRKEKIGIFFLVLTMVLSAVVLFMHVHYSIDVFAAFFIAYGSYKLGNWLLRKIQL